MVKDQSDQDLQAHSFQPLDSVDRREALLGGSAALAVAALSGVALPDLATAQTAGAQGNASAEAHDIAKEAYIFLYPLVLMEITRRQLTNIEAGKMVARGPMNTLSHMRAFPDANFKEVVRPNFDTLYSSGWLDLTREPMVVSVPDTQGRYYLLPMLDMWTDVFAVPGKRTSGTAAANYAVVPPGWSGTLPAGVERIDASTPYVWIIGRTQTNGVADYPAVHKVQDGYRVVSLSQWGKTPSPVSVTIDPSIDMHTPPLRQVANMPPNTFFTLGAELMKIHPPHGTDWSTLARMKRIGIEPGKFDPAKADPVALGGGAVAALKFMENKLPTLARVTNGWQMNTDSMGVYGNYYLKRAIVALAGLGANQIDDAIYPLNVADASGKPVMGENKYTLSFTKDEVPPVEAFWSLTMYDAEGFQVANPINRFAIGDRDALKFNRDGSLDLYVQHENPGAERESNWLPGPKSGALGLTLRLYAPRPQVAAGLWNPPAIRKTD